jgi:hypothetical protein
MKRPTSTKDQETHGAAEAGGEEGDPRGHGQSSESTDDEQPERRMTSSQNLKAWRRRPALAFFLQAGLLRRPYFFFRPSFLLRSSSCFPFFFSRRAP